jgi:hypothetical protein
MVLTNPPFGKKSSVTYITDTMEIVEDLQAALEQFSQIAEDLESADGSG